MKTGDYIKCIRKGWNDLTEGKLYTVVDARVTPSGNYWVTVCDDFGYCREYLSTSRFEWVSAGNALPTKELIIDNRGEKTVIKNQYFEFEPSYIIYKDEVYSIQYTSDKTVVYEWSGSSIVINEQISLD